MGRLVQRSLLVLAGLFLVAGVAGADILKFDFERTGTAKTFEGFTSVTAVTDYKPEVGYGWVGASGPATNAWLEERVWKQGDRGIHGCVRANAMIDALAEDYCTSSVPFVVDLPNGTYHVWVMVGDWGAFEFYPRDSYTVLAQGKEMARKDRSTREKFMAEFLANKYVDYAPRQDLFEIYVTPRFQEARGVAEVTDGKLKIEVRLDAGPGQYGGPINGVVVYPDAQKEEGEKFLAELKAKRKAAFDKNFSYPEVKAAYVEGVTNEERDRGFVLFPTPADGRVTPSTGAGRRETRLVSLDGFATLGEYEPLTFCFTPYNERLVLGRATLTVTALVGPKGDRISESDIQVGYVKYLHEYQRSARPPVVQPVAGLVMDRNWLVAADRVTRQFWVTVHVPENAQGGTYKGTATVTTEGGGSAQVPVNFTVMPIKLDEVLGSVGLNWSFPEWPTWFNDNDAEWNLVDRELAFMRAHNMTTVAAGGFPLPIDNDDTAKFEQFVKLYQKHKYPGIFYHAGIMNFYANATLRSQFGDPYQKAWQDAYCATIRKFDVVARKLGQKTTYSIGDETTNDGGEGTAYWVGKVTKEQLSDLSIASDINGYRELMLMAPNIDVAGFNNGWQGGYRTNRPRRLITRDVVQRVKALGCAPWYINGGVGRYPFGLFYWKSTQWGLEGKVEWHYYASTSDPYNPFDAQQKNSFGSLVYPDMVPTVTMEGSREGIDDCRYLMTLQRLIAEKKDTKDPMQLDVVRKAQDAVDFYVDSVEDARTEAAADGSGESTDKAWPEGRMRDMRQEIAQLIVMLQGMDVPGILPDVYVLEDFETSQATWNKTNSWGGGGAKVDLSTEQPIGGKQSLVVNFPGGQGYVGNYGRLKTLDWRGYRTFTVEVSNPQPKPITVTVNFRDQLASNLGAAALRRTEDRVLAPGANTIKVNLVGMKSDDGKHDYDFSCLFNVFFTVKNEKTDTTLYFDDFRLSRK